MSDVTLNDITSGYNLSKINDNFDQLENAVNNEILHTTGGNNTMGQQLDMNNKRIINLPAPVEPTDAVRLTEYQQWVDTLTGLEGVVPQAQDRQVGDGITTQFDTTATLAASPASFFVNIDGVTQRPGTDYHTPTIGKLDFYEAPYDGAVIDIIFFQPYTINITATIVTRLIGGNLPTDSDYSSLLSGEVYIDTTDVDSHGGRLLRIKP